MAGGLKLRFDSSPLIWFEWSSPKALDLERKMLLHRPMPQTSTAHYAYPEAGGIHHRIHAVVQNLQSLLSVPF